MNLLNSTEELRNYVDVVPDFDFSRALLFIRRVERKYIVPLIGRETYNLLLDRNITDTDILLVKEIVAEASANLAFYVGFAQLNIFVGAGGFLQSDFEQVKQSDWAGKRDLQRSYATTGFDALEETLKLLEEYLDKFPEWRTSPAFTLFDEHFNRSATEFTKRVEISGSRRTFLALKPTLRQIKEQYFLPILGENIITLIKTRTVDKVITRALELAQFAEASLAIAAAVDNGAFTISGSSILYKWEQLPWEKTVIYDSERLAAFKKYYQNAGENYLKLLKEHLKAHPDVFGVEEKEKGFSTSILKLRSGLGF